MENKPTVELHEELAAREGVTEIIVGPYETFQIRQDQRLHEFTGPARVLINQTRKFDVEITIPEGMKPTEVVKSIEKKLASYVANLPIDF